jgi:hypothetical protein
MAYRRTNPAILLPRIAATLVVALVLWWLSGFLPIANSNSHVGYSVGLAIVLVSAILMLKDWRRNASKDPEAKSTRPISA